MDYNCLLIVKSVNIIDIFDNKQELSVKKQKRKSVKIVNN